MEFVYFFRYLLISENIAISCFHDSLTAPIRLVCSCATEIVKK